MHEGRTETVGVRESDGAPDAGGIELGDEGRGGIGFFLFFVTWCARQGNGAFIEETGGGGALQVSMMVGDRECLRSDR
jgi:hypothetical protein